MIILELSEIMSILSDFYVPMNFILIHFHEILVDIWYLFLSQIILGKIYFRLL